MAPKPKKVCRRLPDASHDRGLGRQREAGGRRQPDGPSCLAHIPSTSCTVTLSLQKKESAEARKAREQMEDLAAAEAEAARRAAAGAAMRERAAREARATAVNSRKLNAEWLQRMRTSKLGELHAEAGALSREHDAQVDRYDRLIEVRAAGPVFTLCPPAAKLATRPQREAVVCGGYKHGCFVATAVCMQPWLRAGDSPGGAAGLTAQGLSPCCPLERMSAAGAAQHCCIHQALLRTCACLPRPLPTQHAVPAGRP